MSYVIKISKIIGISIVAYVFSYTIINLQVVYHNIQDIIGFSSNESQIHLSAEIVSENNKEYIIQNKYNIDQQIKSRFHKTKYIFNSLPPDNRIIVSKLGIDTPIVDIKNYNQEKLEKGDFQKELEKGVVKYPGTPHPQQDGNMLFFGHTSDYRRNYNEFANVFTKLPKAENGTEVQVLWQGKLYKYEVTKKSIYKPSELKKLYDYKDNKYMTMIGCYPVGSDASRIAVISKLKSVTQNILAYHHN